MDCPKKRAQLDAIQDPRLRPCCDRRVVCRAAHGGFCSPALRAPTGVAGRNVRDDVKTLAFLAGRSLPLLSDEGKLRALHSVVAHQRHWLSDMSALLNTAHAPRS